jgi:transketolase C-terminal domain/subunit
MAVRDHYAGSSKADELLKMYALAAGSIAASAMELISLK